MRHQSNAVLSVAGRAFVVLLIAACFSSRDPQSDVNSIARGLITGTASSAQQIPLPDDAIFEALLQDVSRPDAPATAIAITAVEDPPKLPLEFTIEFDSARIDPRRNYVVRTRIMDDKKPIWVSDRAHPVLTQGHGASVRIAMRRVGTTEQIGPDGGSMLLGGELTYLSDVARLTECTTRRIYPVSTEDAFPEMQRAYLKLARTLGAPLYVTFEGLILERTRPTGSGTTPTVVVNEFIDAWPSQNCSTSETNAELVNSPWYVTRVGNSRTSEVTKRHAPILLLTGTGDSLTYSSTVGCNRMRGNVKVAGDQIAFGSWTGTRMSCGAPLDSLEQRFSDALARAEHWQVLGQTLEFEDAGGETVVTFERRPR